MNAEQLLKVDEFLAKMDEFKIVNYARERHQQTADSKPRKPARILQDREDEDED